MIYCCVSLEGVFIILNDFLIAYGCTMSGVRIHSKLISNVLHCALSFFDRIPLGRIVNRFSKDLDVVDTQLPPTLDYWLHCVMDVAATLFVLCYGTPFFLIPIVPLFLMYVFIQVLTPFWLFVLLPRFAPVLISAL